MQTQIVGLIARGSDEKIRMAMRSDISNRDSAVAFVVQLFRQASELLELTAGLDNMIHRGSLERMKSKRHIVFLRTIIWGVSFLSCPLKGKMQ